jgi:hypothetical protein
MTDLSELVVKIKADASGLDREMKRATSSVSGASGQMSTALSGLGRQFAALVPVISVASFAAFAKSAFQAADRLNDLSARTGIAASTLSALNIPLLQGGSSAEEFASSVTRMNNAIGEASKGQSQALIDTFNKLGLSIAELMKLTPEQQFFEIARALNSIQNQAEFTNTGMEIFGRSFATLAPLIRESNGNLADFVEQQKKTGNALTEEQLAKIDEWGDSWTSAVERAKIAMADALPIIQLYADGVAGVIDLLKAPAFGAGALGSAIGQTISGNTNPNISTQRPNVLSMADAQARLSAGLGSRSTNPNAPAKGQKDALAEYNKQLQRNLQLSSLTDRQQVALKARFDTLDAAAANGVKISEQAIAANQRLAVQAYDAKKALDAQADATKKAEDAAKQLYTELVNKLAGGLTDAAFSAGSAGDAFKRMAESIARSVFERSIAQPASEAIIGAIDGMGVGSFLKDLLPSFDVGTPYVPQDMVAMIHKGERVVPANQNNPAGLSALGGGGAVTVNQYFQSGVTRSELQGILPEVAKAAHDAVFASVQRGGSAAKIMGVR